MKSNLPKKWKENIQATKWVQIPSPRGVVCVTSVEVLSVIQKKKKVRVPIINNNSRPSVKYSENKLFTKTVCLVTIYAPFCSFRYIVSTDCFSWFGISKRVYFKYEWYMVFHIWNASFDAVIVNGSCSIGWLCGTGFPAFEAITNLFQRRLCAFFK